MLLFQTCTCTSDMAACLLSIRFSLASSRGNPVLLMSLLSPNSGVRLNHAGQVHGNPTFLGSDSSGAQAESSCPGQSPGNCGTGQGVHSLCSWSDERQWPVFHACEFPFSFSCVCAQLLSPVWLFATLWTAACQAPLSKGFSRREWKHYLYWLTVILQSWRNQL